MNSICPQNNIYLYIFIGLYLLMNIFQKRQKFRLPIRAVALCTVIVFLSLSILPSGLYAQGAFNLPQAGTMIGKSCAFTSVIIKALTIYPDNPLQFDFIVDAGDDNLEGEALEKESGRLIRYFMATLTVPEKEMWVNLSPYEKDKIIAAGLENTEMGRDMLAQDYILKQLTSSLTYPENELGDKFWNRVYSKAQEKFGTTKLPSNVFIKIWIVPEKAVVYVDGNNIFVIESHLKVMLERDYLAQENNVIGANHIIGDVNSKNIEELSDISQEVARNILLPEIEKEVNEGKNFSKLRQIYNSMILATWYKKNLRESLLGQVYVDQNKAQGITIKDKQVKQRIYNQYLETFKKGVYDYIKIDYNQTSHQAIPRKYFSGGENFEGLGEILEIKQDQEEEWRNRNKGRALKRIRTRNELIKESSSSALHSQVLTSNDTLARKAFKYFQQAKNILLLSEQESISFNDIAQQVDFTKITLNIVKERGPPSVRLRNGEIVFNASLGDDNALILSRELFRQALKEEISKKRKEEVFTESVQQKVVNDFYRLTLKDALQNDEDLILAYKAAGYLTDFGKDIVEELVMILKDKNIDYFTGIHTALTLWKIKSDNIEANKAVQSYREKYPIFNEAINLLENYESLDEQAPVSIEGQSEKGKYITLLSLHGFIKNDQKLAIDPDTGGQITYVMELARALGKLPGVDRVDLITRLIPEFEGTETPEYSQVVEPLSSDGKVNIVRIPFAGEKYKLKQYLWPNIKEFTDNFVEYLQEQKRFPDVVWTNYADAGLAGAMLSKKIKGLTNVHTVHSLGLPKMANMATRETIEELDNNIHILTRIIGEEIHFTSPVGVFTNTKQESIDQIGMYINAPGDRVTPVPPGANLVKYAYEVTDLKEKNDPRRVKVIELLERETSDQLPEKRQALAPVAIYSRLDEKKNYYGLIDAYGQNSDIQEKANLYLGLPNIPSKLQGEEKRIYEKMVQMINDYGIKDKVVFSTAGVLYMPEVYRWLVDKRGVFAQMAFTEPFGLMNIEARAVGVPVVSTDNGGPLESIHDGIDGFLVNVRDPKAVGEAIYKILNDDELWNQFSVKGREDVFKRYTWDKTAQRGATVANQIKNNNVSVAGNNQDVGGIDFNSAMFDLETRQASDKFLPSLDFTSFSNTAIAGVFSVIVNIQPVINSQILFE